MPSELFCRSLKLARGFKWTRVLPDPATRAHYSEAQYQALIGEDNLLFVLVDKAGRRSTLSFPPKSLTSGHKSKDRFLIGLTLFYIMDATGTRFDVSDLT